MTQLHLRRGSEPFGVLRKLKVFVDDKRIGTVRWKDTLTADLTPGTHSVTVRMDWVVSPPLAIVASDAADLHVDVEVPNILTATLRVFTQPRRVFTLRLR